MTDLTADLDIRVLGQAYTERFPCHVNAVHTFYRGQAVVIDQNVTTLGRVIPFIDATHLVAADVFVGIAAETVDVAASQSPIPEVECYVEPTIVGYPDNATFTDADLGATVYADTSGLLTAEGTDNPPLGIIHIFHDGYMYVRLISPTITAQADA